MSDIMIELCNVQDPTKRFLVPWGTPILFYEVPLEGDWGTRRASRVGILTGEVFSILYESRDSEELAAFHEALVYAIDLCVRRINRVGIVRWAELDSIIKDYGKPAEG